jgi:hypothetical protein
METKAILAQIDAEIARMEQVKSILLNGAPKPGRKFATAKAPTAKKRVLSPEARARIAAAQKARWAKAKQSAK